MQAQPMRTIHIRPEAPPKPREGQPCNGCGVCCLSEPCPWGVWLSKRRTGACVALEFDGGQVRYVCGALTRTRTRLGAALMRRWIAAGKGCDCTLELESPAQSSSP